MTGRKTRHIVQRPGPTPDHPFRVVQGWVAVHALERRHSLCIPAGGTWPGLDALDAATAQRLHAWGTTMLAGTVLDHAPTPEQMAEGGRLVLVQLLGRGELAARLSFLDALGVAPRSVNQTTLAALIGTTRESIAKLLNGRQRHRTDAGIVEQGQPAREDP